MIQTRPYFTLIDTLVDSYYSGTTTLTGEFNLELTDITFMNSVTFFGWLPIEWIMGAILFLLIAVVLLSISLYFIRQEVKRITKFNFLIREDVAEDVKKVRKEIKDEVDKIQHGDIEVKTKGFNYLKGMHDSD